LASSLVQSSCAASAKDTPCLSRFNRSLTASNSTFTLFTVRTIIGSVNRAQSSGTWPRQPVVSSAGVVRRPVTMPIADPLTVRNRNTSQGARSRLARRSSAHDFERMAALAGVGWYGRVLHTKITRSRRLRLQRYDSEGLVAPARYIRFPSPAPQSSLPRNHRLPSAYGATVRCEFERRH
jgi:hypothetical protein